MKNYSYPIEVYWSKNELTTVISLWNGVEQAYEGSIDKDDFLHLYRAFKKVVPGKADEKKLSKAFETSSGYSLYRVVQEATNTTKRKISINPERRNF